MTGDSAHPSDEGRSAASVSGPAPVDDRAALLGRLAALEAENATLRATATATATATGAAALGAGPGGAPSAGPVARRRRPGRATAAVLLLVVGALLAPVAVAVTWARSTIVDTDRYLATVAPLADDPTIQAAVTNRVTDAIVDAIDLDSLVSNVTGSIAGLGLPPRASTLLQSLGTPIVDATTGFIHTQVGRVVGSDAFATAWTQANRTAQRQLVAVLRGDPDAVAGIDADGTLSVDLTPVIDAVRQVLSDNGFTIVDSLPTISASFPLLQNSDLVRLENAYSVLDLLGTWLPWVVVGLLAAGVLCAQRRARALLLAGLAFAVAMLVTRIGVAVARSLYVDSLPATVQRPDAALAVFDQLVHFLEVAIRAGFVLGLVVAVAAFFATGSAAARAVRSVLARLASWLRSLGDRHGVGTGALGVWLDEQRVLVRVVVGLGAALALVLAGYLTARYVVTVAVVAGLVLLVVQLLSRPAGRDGSGQVH